jgi:hypothetical protein
MSRSELRQEAIMTGGPLGIRASSETKSLLLRLHDLDISVLSLLESGAVNRSITRRQRSGETRADLWFWQY